MTIKYHFKSKNIIAIALFCLFWLIPELSGQEIWYNVVSIPPSPNASSLGKFGEFPIDKSTGVPSISIPVFEISYGGIKVPISLDYHASGIKVNDEESWVGMGWSLNAGGVITRVMRGRPDELQYGFLTHSGNIPMEEDITTRYYLPGCSLKDSLNYISNNQWDYEPDIFYYNFANSSGSFWIDWINGNYVCRPRPESKETFEFINYQSSYSFRIKDTEGNIYSFEEAELSTVDIKGSIPEYISSWYLTSISNPRTGRIITFTYGELDDLDREWNLSQSKMYRQLVSGYYEYIYGTDQYSSVTSSIRDEKYLSQIDFGENSIVFLRTTAFLNHQKLNLISVSTGQGPIKHFTFDYQIVQSLYTQRLKLVAFREMGDSIGKTYSFDYDEQTLPDRNSKMIDHWGYYNGQNNSELIPQQILGNQVVCTADRDSHWPYTQAGTLKKITFPTGGYTEFEFENNEYSYTGDYPTIPKSYTLGVVGNYYSQNCISRDYIWISGDSVYSDASITTTVTAEGQPSAYEINLLNSVNEKSKSGPISNSQIGTPEHYGIFDFRSSGMALAMQPLVQTMGFGDIVYYDSLMVEAGSSFVGPIDSLPADRQYTHTACASDHLTTTSSTFFYKVRKEGVTTHSIKAGGLRIKKIKTYDPVSGDTLFKTYDYNLSGYLTSGFPSYSREAKYYYNTEFNGPVTLEPRMFLYSHAVDGLGVSSNSVAYSKVTEILGTENDNNGKIETIFISSQDQASAGYYYTPSLSNQWLRSKILSETYFRKNGNDYDTILQKNYTYTSTPGAMTIGFKASRISTFDVQGNQIPCYYDEFAYNNFPVTSFNLLLASESVKQYFQESNIVQTTTFNYYDTINWYHFFPVQTKMYNSNGDKITTRYVYPTDTTAISPFSYMKNNNMIGLPLKRSVSVNNTKTQEFRWNYNYNNLIINKLCLESAEELIWDSAPYAYRPVMTYQKYDEYGNPTQIMGKDGIVISYIWGYNSNYVVAIIENASYDEVVVALGGSIILVDGHLSLSQDNSLRAALPNARITSYTHKPYIGITSQSDPNGIKTYFEYDGFGRLNLIKDNDGRILKTFVYHYKQ